MTSRASAGEVTLEASVIVSEDERIITVVTNMGRRAARLIAECENDYKPVRIHLIYGPNGELIKNCKKNQTKLRGLMAKYIWRARG